MEAGAGERFTCLRTQYTAEIPDEVEATLTDAKEILCESLTRFVPPAFWNAFRDAITSSTDILTFRGAPPPIVTIRAGEIAAVPSETVPWSRVARVAIAIEPDPAEFARARMVAPMPEPRDYALWFDFLEGRLRRRFAPCFGAAVRANVARDGRLLGLTLLLVRANSGAS